MKVFYRPEQNTDYKNSFSPSASKPKKVVEDWLAQAYITPHDIQSFEPLSVDTIALAHDRRYVEGVLSGALENGFGNKSKQVASTLPCTTGSFLAAAEYALKHNTHTLSPTSGFHHACHSGGGGYCTFNGLMITALHLQKTGQAQTVGILDLDQHYGNGTDQIIEKLGATGIENRSAGAHFATAKDVGGNSARNYWKWLEESLDIMRRCDIVLYQAGVDCHNNDPLGGYLSSKQMMVREEMVVLGLARKPMVTNLAGGYQIDEAGTFQPVINLHRILAKTYCKNASLFDSPKPKRAH